MRYFNLIPILLAALLCVACGDGPTNDDRGYTKAPLERPGPFVRAEQPGPMRELGTPNLPRPVVIQLEPAAGG